MRGDAPDWRRSRAMVFAGVSIVFTMFIARRADARPLGGDPPSASRPAPITITLARAHAIGLKTSRSSANEGGARLVDTNEIRREMRSARGRVLFVHLWASWCGPCLDELPLVDRFARAARARGATVISLSLDSEPRAIARVSEVLRARAPDLTTFVARFDDPDQFMSLFSRGWEGAIPALFAFDAAGKLNASLIGEVEPEELRALLTRMSPPAAERSVVPPESASARRPKPAGSVGRKKR